jgi:hypothetical protein
MCNSNAGGVILRLDSGVSGYSRMAEGELRFLSSCRSKANIEVAIGEEYA